MENQIHEETENLPRIEFNEEIKYYLYETAKWGKMLSVIGFILIGFIVILGICFEVWYSFRGGTNPGLIGRANPGLARMPGGGIGLAIIWALLHLFPTVFLYQFSNNTKQAIDHNSELQMTEAFTRLKSLFKFYGIYALAIVIFYVLVMIAAIAGGMAFMHAMQR